MPTRVLLTALLLLPLSEANANEPWPVRECSINLNSAVDPGSNGAAKRLAFIDSSVPEKNLILDDADVKSQGAYGCCWISTVHGDYQRLIRKRFGKEIPLSDDYHLLISILIRLEEGIHEGHAIKQGGWTVASEWMARNIGLVPESAWKPRVPLRHSESRIGEKLVDYLNTEIAAFQVRLAEMKKRRASEEAVWTFGQATKSRLRDYVRKNFGAPPSRFTIDGVSYTPHSFAQAILPPDQGSRTLVEYLPSEPRPEPVASQKKKIRIDPNLGLFAVYPNLVQKLPRTLAKMDPSDPTRVDPKAYRLFNRSYAGGVELSEAPLSTLHEKIAASLASGQVVYVATPMVKRFYDRKIGLMAVTANGFQQTDVVTAPFSGGHAMLITGVYRDVNLDVLGYRVQNSWGTAVGELGYYYMARDYFDAFVNRISIPVQKTPSSSPPEPI